MVNLLARCFLKNWEDKKDPKVRKGYGTLCSLLGIALNVILFTGKFLVGSLTGSVAITADAFNNLSDAGSSFITLIGFQFAGAKPDPSHPYGHGRIEYLSGLAVSVAILLMGFELAKTSIGKIIHPEAVDTSLAAFAVLIASVLVKLYMCFYNRKVGEQIDSAAMKATAADSLSDSVATTVVFIGMLILKFTGVNVDGISGVLVAVFILYAGYGAAKDTLNPLLGQPPEKEFVDRIEQIVMSYNEIEGIHDLIVHDYGPGRIMISLHAEVPGNRDIFELHDVVDQAELRLNEELGCEAVIHMDPIVVDDQAVSEMKQRVTELVHGIDEKISIHDFRMVQGPTHTNLIFDAVVPLKFRLSDEEVMNRMKEGIRSMQGNYFGVVKIDKPYVQE